MRLISAPADKIEVFFMCVHMGTNVCMCASVCAWVCVNEGWRLKKKNKSRKDGSFFLNKRQSLALLGCSLV